jgi:hypothetical protein
MPPVLFLALIGAVGIFGYRILSNLAVNTKATPRRASSQTRRAGPPVRDLGNLEWDEGAGVYRPGPRREG